MPLEGTPPQKSSATIAEGYTMISTDRILTKNFWCESDEKFVVKITRKFQDWIHRVKEADLGGCSNSLRHHASSRDETCCNRLHSIPMIMHFIWLGSEVPRKYSTFIDKWKLMHPKWEVHIWDDESKLSSFLHH
jgi:mannosyltransferase OCH1-like enzyme